VLNPATEIRLSCRRTKVSNKHHTIIAWYYIFFVWHNLWRQLLCVTRKTARKIIKCNWCQLWRPSFRWKIVHKYPIPTLFRLRIYHSHLFSPHRSLKHRNSDVTFYITHRISPTYNILVLRSCSCVTYLRFTVLLFPSMYTVVFFCMLWSV